MASDIRSRLLRSLVSMAALYAALAIFSLLPKQHANAAQVNSPSQIPFRDGLTFVYALHYSGQDYESITSVDSVTGQGAKLTVSYSQNGQEVVFTRVVTNADALHAHKRQIAYVTNGGEDYPGTTAPTVSLDILNDLKTHGSTQYSVVQTGSALGLFSMSLESSGTIHRVEPNDVMLHVIVNDVPTQLPAVHARGVLNGTLNSGTYELYILDDQAFPLVLSHNEGSGGSEGGQIVKINYPQPTATKSLENRLATSGRARVYGIYFDFNSANVRDQSTPALEQIAAALNANSNWKLVIEGHTDNLGSDAYNLDLSRRRAAAVKTVLVSRYHIAAERLTTVGYGASRPVASNATLEGRALNRRVELVRQ